MPSTVSPSVTPGGCRPRAAGPRVNRSINPEVRLVTCDDCGTNTGHAAFRVASDTSRIGSEYPAGNTHVTISTLTLSGGVAVRWDCAPSSARTAARRPT
ncbi:MAG: hypothetical protein JW751_14860 [Polyangiaceae bacterium]|nr:hypothetical protein [Polyangiaceae bacterium]